MNRLRQAIYASVSALAVVCATGAAYGQTIETKSTADDEKIHWSIPAQPLADALIAWSERSNHVVLIQDDLTAGYQSAALAGAFTKFQALERLLESSGLTYRVRDDETIVIATRLQTAAVSAPGFDSGASSPKDQRYMRLAQATGAPPQESASDELQRERHEDDEVIVTGTRIRGASPAAPVRSVTRVEIERSGRSQIGELLRTLPENFAGGANRGAQTSPVIGPSNLTDASTVNLRGLGPDASLTLVNGHRLTTDALWGGADISAIPLAAIQRVEIVTDGASALYGSDAVAGVVNFILRSDFEGAEASARVGGATRGGGFEQTYNVLAGGTWSTGHVLGGGEHLRQNAIRAADRDFTSEAGPLNTLLAPQERASVFLTAHQDLLSWASAELTAVYSDRSSQSTQDLAFPDLPMRFIGVTDVATTAFLVAPRLRLALPADWKGTLEANYSESENDFHQTSNFGTDTRSDLRNVTRAIEANASGVLFDLPTGPVRLALGAGYRDEKQDYAPPASGAGFSGRRHMRYAFGEILVPLVPPSATRLGLQQLDLSVAARFEAHSDFGDTTTPRLGLRYVPLDGLAMRATWGESFKAPLFRQVHSPVAVQIVSAAALGAAEPGATAIVVAGGARDLDPERSASWTIGFDWTRGLNISATYFNIDYRDRIVIPITSLGATFLDPHNAPFIAFDPSPADQAAAIASADLFSNETGAPHDPEIVLAIVSAGFVNARSQAVEGVDLSLSKSFKLGPGTADFFANGSWLNFAQRTLPTQPSITRSGHVFHPAEFRSRFGATYRINGMTATAAVNHTTGSTDDFAVPPADVDPWTTVDLNIQYQVPNWSAGVAAPLITFSATNLLDAPPPFAAGGAAGAPGMTFDSANASPVGRFLAVTLRQRF